MAEPEMDTPDMQELDAGASENLEPEFQFDLKNETAADAQPINDEIAAVRPRPPQDELSLLTTAVAGGKVRTILVAGLSNGIPMLLLSGRAHAYEGFSQREITILLRACLSLGISTLMLTNASGGINSPAH